MAILLKRLSRSTGKWISDMFYAHYIASYSGAGAFEETQRLAQEMFGIDKDRSKR